MHVEKLSFCGCDQDVAPSVSVVAFVLNCDVFTSWQQRYSLLNWGFCGLVPSCNKPLPVSSPPLANRCLSLGIGLAAQTVRESFPALWRTPALTFTHWHSAPQFPDNTSDSYCFWIIRATLYNTSALVFTEIVHRLLFSSGDTSAGSGSDSMATCCVAENS